VVLTREYYIAGEIVVTNEVFDGTNIELEHNET